ncbi:MAG TPA: glycosyltransferase [bacterium]
MITNIFPNSKNPDSGTYVADQVDSLNPFVEIKVVAKTRRSALGFVPFAFKIGWASLFTKHDLIHAHYGFHSAMLPVLLRRQPLVVTFHGSDALIEPTRNRCYRYLQRSVVAHATHLVAVSQQVQAHLVGELGANAKKVSVIACGVDTERFRFRPRAQARRQLSLLPEMKLALFIGRFTHAKGVDLIKTAASSLKDVDFYFIGTGPLKWRSSNCHFIGLVDHAHIPQWLSAADVVLLPSRSEGTPVTVLEALACETPVICSAVGACPELIVDGATGLLIPIGDAGSLVTAIQRALSEVKFDSRLGRDFVVQNFDVKIIAEKLLSLYSGVLSAGKTNGSLHKTSPRA